MCANYFVFDILLYRFKRNTYQDYGNEGDDGYIYDDGGYIYDENTRIVEGYVNHVCKATNLEHQILSRIDIIRKQSV